MQGEQALSATPISVTTSPGTGWSATGSLASDRLLHTATRLQDGRVLVVGGYEASAELYDPATGVWSATGAAPGNYRRATATLLPSGKVLVTGAPDSGVSAALYDPTTGTWSPTGNLTRPRQYHTATLLPNGRVLVAGGADPNGNTLASAELYDPATGTWVAAAGMGVGRREHAAVLLPSGQMLVAGGRVEQDGARLSSAALYDPATNTWTNAGAMATARANYTATVLPSGKVLVAGGGLDGATATTAELYDPAAQRWSAAHGMHEPRRRHTATLLPSGQVLVVGGYDNTTGILTSSELYDPAHDAWYAMAPMAVDRYEHTATLLANGRVLVAGGSSNGNQASAELYAAAFTKVVLEAGTGWQLVNISGATSDTNAQPFNADLYVVDGALGVANAPLPAGFRDQLAQGAAIEETVHYLDRKIIDELQVAEQTGVLTPALEAIAEPAGSSIAPSAGLSAMGLASGACPDRWYGKATNLSESVSIEKTFDLSEGDLQATLTTKGGLGIEANAEVSAAMTFSRFTIPLLNKTVCIPAGVNTPQLQASATGTLELGATLTGQLQRSWPFDIAKPHLGVVVFIVPGINLPVVISFDLPITAGVDLDASLNASGAIKFSAQQKSSIGLNFACTIHGCTSASPTYGLEPPTFAPPEIQAGATGRIEPKVWAQVALRADLYRSGTYMQFGVRPYLEGDLWAYAGNTCGDADGDGQGEWVSATTFGLDARIRLLGEVGAPLVGKQELELASFGPWRIGFWDLLPGGSSAIQPMLIGPASVNQFSSSSYALQMRPCWPYTHDVDYRLDWGDGSEVLRADPQATVTRLHSWDSAGTKTVTATAVQDAHGRQLNAMLTRNIQVSSGAPPPPPPPPHARTLYSEHVVAHSAIFLNGGSGDDAVNDSVLMPVGCEVLATNGVHYHQGGPQLPAEQMIDHGIHGFSVNDVGGDPRDLSTSVHWWHEGISSIIMRVAYTIMEPDGVDCSVPGFTRDSL